MIAMSDATNRFRTAKDLRISNKISVTTALLSLTTALAHADDFQMVPSIPDMETSEQEVVTSNPSGNNALPFASEIEGLILHGNPREESPFTSGRLSARLHGHSKINDEFGVQLNARFRLELNDQTEFDFDNDARLDTQELALTYSPDISWTWILGRYNVRNGVASGFNPTDWFKDNSQIVVETFDVADRRNDRLGILSFQGVFLTPEALINFGYRPEVSDGKEKLTTDKDIFGLSLDRTNSEDALWVKYTPSRWKNLSLTGTGLYIKDKPAFGLELSMAVSESVVIYGEWSEQKRLSIPAEAIGSDASIYGNTELQYYSQIATGFTWSVGDNFVGDEDISLSLEYHYNEAGLDKDDLSAWKASTTAGKISGIANRRQEPLARHQLFARIGWNDVIGDSDLSLITTYTPLDESGFSQLSLSIPTTDTTKMKLQSYVFFGGDETIYGGNTQEYGVMLTFTKFWE
ncbi:hypothetical protein BGP75_20470 [Motiliproteus sp. MSK22-1]|nr:hypothetical protein BGP75_20470 [Motiliproteus sp. MSK22-1]